MNRKWLLAVGVADLLVLSWLDKVAFSYYLYWKYAWFDILMHLIGGLAVGLLSGWAYLELKVVTDDSAELNWRQFLGFNLSFALIIGAVWELFELVADRIVVFNWFDSSKDMLFGLIGSVAAGLLAGKISQWRHRKQPSILN